MNPTISTETETEPESTDASAVASFDELPLSEPVRRAIDEAEWTQPTPVQLETYPLAVEGVDLIVQSRTGTGKTAAFGIPLIDRLVRPQPKVQALILAPTRELALQSQRELERIGKHTEVRTAAVYGGAPMDRQVRQLREGVAIVSGTPGRVLDHLRRGTLDVSGLKVLVLDEADEILSMGFAKELNAIIELLPKQRQTLLFSATVDDDVQRVADRHMTEPRFVTLSGDAVGATGVSHYVYMVTGKGRTRDLIRVLEVEDPESAIVFCNTKAETEQVAAELQQAGFNADWLNGDLPQNEREKIMRRTRDGKLRYLVATDVAARGIDISHLTHVINYTLPESAQQYIHRTGRTGRAGRTGTAVSLVSPLELGTLYFLRLQYKIFPVERRLPTAGEERTRAETDRLLMLEQAFPQPPTEMDLAVARRLLTHPDAERLLAGLLDAFFGARGEDVDEQAAAARRSRAPEPVEEAPAETRSPDRDRDRDRKRDRDRDRGGDRDRDRDRKRDRDRGRGRDRDRDRAKEDRKQATSQQKGLPEGGEDGDGAPQEDRAVLHLNVGKKDGVRAGGVARLMRDRTELSRREIGRIRVRDKHTFVTIPEQRVDEVLGALNGYELEGKALVVERAKSDG
ncbi:MAG: DEAD/DEAH box helicase [Myxococcota bacterium]